MPGEDGINILAFVISISILVAILVIAVIILFIIKAGKNSNNANGSQGPQGFRGLNGTVGPTGAQGDIGKGVQGPPGGGSAGTARTFTASVKHQPVGSDSQNTAFVGAIAPVPPEPGNGGYKFLNVSFTRTPTTTSLGERNFITMTCSLVVVFPPQTDQQNFGFNITLPNGFELLAVDPLNIYGWNGYGNVPRGSAVGVLQAALIDVQASAVNTFRLVYGTAITGATPNGVTWTTGPQPPVWELQYNISYIGVA